MLVTYSLAFSSVVTSSPFSKGYLDLPTAYKPYPFEFSGQTFREEMLHRSWSNSVLGTLTYNTATLVLNVAAFSSS